VSGIDPRIARGIRLVVLDVDGVLTDNGLYIGMAGGAPTELKRFDVQDGLGLHLLRIAGIPVALLSGRFSEATRLRAAELGIADVIQDPSASKLPRLQALLDERGIRWDEVLYAGDDLADVPVLRRVGMPVTVANGVAEARAVSAYVTERAGGAGAVREMVETLLHARGEWDGTLAQYYRERGGDST
jgi:3-deoxy-D-manno-octulosonate 8-phosphate phosphatase (KDO 8-P phosphatase)